MIMVKKVFICSPYGDPDPMQRAKNVNDTMEICKIASDKGHAPFAPHLLYPLILDDMDPDARQKGINFGLNFMGVCDEVWIYSGNGITSGMQQEILQAGQWGKTLLYSENIHGFNNF